MPMADVTELLHSARRAVEAGDHRKALTLLDEAAAKPGPPLFGVQMLRGICLSELGRPIEGVEALKRAVELNPTSAQGHYSLANALCSANRSKEAEQHFRHALRLQPGYEAAADALKSLDARVDSPALRASTTPLRHESPPTPPQHVAPLPQTGRSAGTRTKRSRPVRMPLSADMPRPNGVFKGLRAQWKWATLVLLAVSVGIFAGVLQRRGPDTGYIVWQAPGDFAALDFSPDGELVVGAGDNVTLWRVATGVPFRNFTWGEQAVDIAFSPKGTSLAVASRDERTGDSVKLWRMPDSGLVWVLPRSAGTRPLEFSPDGKVLAIGTDYMSAASPPGVQLWYVPTRKLVGAVAKPHPVAPGYVTAIVFARAGKLIASADDSGTICITDIAERKELCSIQTGNMMGMSLAVSPVEDELAYGGNSGPDIVMCSIPDCKVILTLKGETHTRSKLGLPPAITGLAYSPDGSLLAACKTTGDLAKIELFRVSDGTLLKTVDSARLFASSSARLFELRDIKFSPDGQYLAWCGSGGIAVARVANLSEMAVRR